MFNLPMGVNIRDVKLVLVVCRDCHRHGTVNLLLGDLVVRRFRVSSAEDARCLHAAFVSEGGHRQPAFLDQVRGMVQTSNYPGVSVIQVLPAGYGVVILVGDELVVNPFGDPFGTRLGGSDDPWGESDLDRDLDDDQ